MITYFKCFCRFVKLSLRQLCVTKGKQRLKNLTSTNYYPVLVCNAYSSRLLQ